MSDAAITAVVSGAAGVLGALVGGMSSYFVQKSTNLVVALIAAASDGAAAR